MNKIYIINNEYNIECVLYFNNNKILINNIYYDFKILNKNILLVFWNNESDIEEFYTEDSYLYFSDKIDNNIKINYSKYYVIHNEWYDQIILNNDKKTLFRINYKNETGSFLFEKDKLIIYWDNWHYEIFIKFDDFTYIKENTLDLKNDCHYNNLIYLPKIAETNKDCIIYNKIHIFIHICTIENWEEIFKDQLLNIKKSGLYDKCEKIHLGILGFIDDNYFNKYYLDDNKKLNILYIDNRIHLYEIPTINSLKELCAKMNNEIFILYIHTKGVRKAGNYEVTKSWRKMMEYFLIEQWEKCIYYLNNYDTLGNNIINDHCYDLNKIAVNKNHSYHYSGNFWWSKKSYIDKLPYLNLDLNLDNNLRYLAENWILSNYPYLKYGILFQDNTNIHPYHRFVFDYYRNMKFIVKENF